MDFINAIKKRRSIYKFKTESPISNSEIKDLINSATKHVPTAYNMHSNVTVLLLGDENKKFWNIVLDVLSGIVTPENFVNTKDKINNIATSYGTVLYFINKDIIDKNAEKNPEFAHNYAEWSIQSNAMLQYTIWTLFTQVGLGANLQHYNPIVDEKVYKEWNLPKNLILKAQMPFGIIDFTPKEKEFLDDKEIFFVFE